MLSPVAFAATSRDSGPRDRATRRTPAAGPSLIRSSGGTMWRRGRDTGRWNRDADPVRVGLERVGVDTWQSLHAEAVRTFVRTLHRSRVEMGTIEDDRSGEDCAN